MQANAAKADGQRAWWKLPRGNWKFLSVVSVLRVRSLANGRLECPNKGGLCAGKCSKGWRPEGLVEAAARELEGLKRFKGFKGSLANGRLECPNKRRLCAGKGQAATLEQQRLTAKGLGGSWGLNAPTTERYVQAKGMLQCWNSKSWRPEGLVEAAARELEGFNFFKGFKRLKPGKRQAWVP